jgi:ATP-dependent protease ClpP protease subunit
MGEAGASIVERMRRLRTSPWFGGLLAGILIVAAAARADRVVLKDGRSFEGEIKAEDEQAVTLEVVGATTGFTQKIKKVQIETWYRPTRKGAAYVTLPIVGVIGEDVNAEALRAGLEEARKAKAKFVILAIDSPGGRIGDMAEMVDVLTGASKEMEIVAYVKRAYSAAAVIAMTCRDVYMTPDASLGATVAFQMTETGPKDVDAKFRSIIEAKMRTATAQGRHADLLIRGMSEIDLELYVTQIDGKAEVSTTGPGKLVKSKGQILCLTSTEAAECGLATVAPDMADLGMRVAGGEWYAASRRPWSAVNNVIARQHAEIDRARQALRRRAALAQIDPEREKIQTRMGELVGKVVAAKDAIALLTKGCNAELKRIDAEYRQAVQLANNQPGAAGAAARAMETKNSRAAAARQNWQAGAAQWQSQGEAAMVELTLLRERDKALLATVPTD